MHCLIKMMGHQRHDVSPSFRFKGGFILHCFSLLLIQRAAQQGRPAFAFTLVMQKYQARRQVPCCLNAMARCVIQLITCNVRACKRSYELSGLYATSRMHHEPLTSHLKNIIYKLHLWLIWRRCMHMPVMKATAIITGLTMHAAALAATKRSANALLSHVHCPGFAKACCRHPLRSRPPELLLQTCVKKTT